MPNSVQSCGTPPHKFPTTGIYSPKPGLPPKDVTNLDDLTKVPISSKADFATLALDERLSSDADPTQLIPHVTSGSTGALLDIRRTRLEELRVHSFQFRAQLLAGLRPSDCRAFLGDAWDRKLYHRAGLFRLEGIGSNPEPDDALRRLWLLQPEIIVGHPSLLEMMLRSPRREEFARLQPRLLFTGAEMLSPHARQTYEQVFRCPVIDFYGAHEAGHIACQCRSCGLYHTCDDSIIVEVLRDGQPAGPGEDGEIVVTLSIRRRCPSSAIAWATSCDGHGHYPSARSASARLRASRGGLSITSICPTAAASIPIPSSRN